MNLFPTFSIEASRDIFSNTVTTADGLMVQMVADIVKLYLT